MKQQLARDQVGTHPANGDGLGLNSQDVMELIAAICEVGFDDSVPNPLCVEIPLNDRRIFDFNRVLIEQSNGILPERNVNVMKCASISSSHANAALRCLIHGSLGCPGMHDDGLTWRVISHQVLNEFPGVPNLLHLKPVATWA